MKASELRIGNIGHDPNHYGGGIDIVIKQINVTSENKSWWDDLNPIPLTEDVLVRCGFEKSDGAFYLKVTDELDFSFRISFTGTSWRIRNVISKIGITHLHQLQNLYFALTGQELIYEFK